MITIFRKIRQKLIADKRASKYLLYAIGEILLVVIGILIALQINNWNENRKERTVELKILKSIKNDLEQDIVNLNATISLDKRFIANNKALIEILEDASSTFQEKMDTLFGTINRYAVFYPQKTGYESLKSTGLEVLQSDSLKGDIVTLYDFHYGYVNETLEIKKQFYLNSNEIFVKELKTTGGSNNENSVNYKKPINFNKLKKNDIFKNHLSHYYFERINLLNFTKNTLAEMKRVLAKIEVEIKSMVND